MIPQVDLIKAFAIVSVLLLHSLTKDDLLSTYAVLHIWQAVPIFIILMVYNQGLSFNRKGFTHLNQVYTFHYWKSKLQRILIPLLFIWLISFAIGIARHNISINKFTLLGYLPFSGPGNYYIPLVIQFVIFFPAIYVLHTKRPLFAIASCFLIDLTFQLSTPHIQLLSQAQIYSGSLFRYFSAIGLGLWLLSGKYKTALYTCAVASIAYLSFSNITQYTIPFFIPSWWTQNMFSFFYPALLIDIGLRYLPRKEIPILHLLGKASYHIFLVQILYYGLRLNLSVFLNLVICCGIGTLFYYAASNINQHNSITTQQLLR